MRTITKLALLVLMTACGKEAELIKSQEGVITYRECDGLAGDYTSEDGIQKLKINDCRMSFRAPYSAVSNLEFDATISSTSQTAGWLYVEITRKSDTWELPKIGTNECTFSLSKGTLAMVCKSNILKQKFYRDM